MSEQETYQALKEILPELQSKLRQNIEHEYQEELQKMQQYYKKYAEDMIAKRQEEIRIQNETNQVYLRRELSLIQRQRQQWLTLEQNYRRTIFELTDRLKDSKKVTQMSVLAQIDPQNNFTEPDLQVMTWKKKSKVSMSNQLRQARKDTLASNFNSNSINSSTNLIRQVCNTQSEPDQVVIEQKIERQSSQKKKWKINDKNQSSSDTQQRAKRQDTLVLSPPKLEQEKVMKNTLLQPPNHIICQKTSIFWNQQGKKKFLTMIRNIK